MQQFTLATSVAALLFSLLSSAGASPSFARGGKKEAGTAVPSAVNQQFEWENKVVGPKEGLDHDKVAATRERGIREEEERKKEVPKKKVKVVAEPSTASIPTQDIEKPAAPVERKKKVAAAPAPKKRDALDNLLDEQGVKPNNPTAGTHSSGLDSVLASDDKPAGSKAGRKPAKKSRGRRRN